MARKRCDLLVSNGVVITMNRKREIIKRGSVAVSDGRILEVGSDRRIMERYEPEETVDARGRIVMPGLVNTHTHSAMTLFRGYADDYPLKEWLENYIWPLEKRFISRRFIRTGTKLAVCEMLRSGTTTFNDMYVFQDEFAAIAEKAGIRAVLGELIFDFPTACVPSPEKGIKHIRNMARKWKGHPLVRVAAAPHSPYACSAEVLRDFRELANELGLYLHIHLSETREEVSEMKKKHGVTPVRYLRDIGVLDGKTLAAHCVHVTEEDIGILARSKTGVAHNPESNMKLATGVAPVPDMMSAGVRLGLGTDSAASNNNLDLFGEMSAAARLHKVFRNDPTAMSAQSAVELSTIGGAAAIGMENETGSIEAGKSADMIIVNQFRPHATPLYNYYSHIVYCMCGHDVDTVIINGKIVIAEKNLLTMDEGKVMKEAGDFEQVLRG